MRNLRGNAGRVFRQVDYLKEFWMKKTKQVRATGVCARKLFTVMVALLLVFGFNACSNGGGGGGPAGGPSGPVTGDGGKYTNSATGEDYKVGDTGPGGGKIFYDSVEAYDKGETSEKYFTLYKGANDTEGVDARYLEASEELGKREWTHWTHAEYLSVPLIGTTEKVLGSGRKNTALILAEERDAPAAKLCADYRGGGLNDWFLPSYDELFMLLSCGFDINGDGYSSSSEAETAAEYNNDGIIMYAILADSSIVGGNASKFQALIIRAIRAF